MMDPATTTSSYRRRYVVLFILALVISTFRSEKQVMVIQKLLADNWSNNVEYEAIDPVLNTSFEKDDDSKNTTVITTTTESTDAATINHTARRPSPETSNNNMTSVITTTVNKSAASNGVTIAPNHNDDELPACQIRVSNMLLAHYEVIESVAKLIPYDYLNLPDTCNHRDLYFSEFSVKSDGSVRPRTWLADFNHRVTNTSTLDNATGIQRSFGPAILIGSTSGRTEWDTTIQASCQCNEFTKSWLLDTTSSDAPHICIHHGLCNWTSGMPNAIYMSPHHKRYFVPSALPPPPPVQEESAQQQKKNSNNNNNEKKLEICTIGSIGRRKWKFFTPFFENPSNAKYFDKIRIRMLGRGHMPPLMAQYKNKTEIKCKQLNDDRKFYAFVMTCGVIVLPITKEGGYKNYFKSPRGSEWKLSGTIPPIIAYQKSFLLPQELVELYHKELPLHLPHRGYNDETDTSFAEALSSLLEEMINNATTTTTTTMID
mmetsp:Transcript_41310/g.99519  ORF Transcript_41310/g.99519 Transcript_41310/m.99519 type:complete len:487 (-) Transcript_41310:27-1487(-)